MRLIPSAMKALSILLLALGLLMQTSISHAVNPGEMLKDPVMEKRAREISAHLRCMVCQNESIDDSNADLAKDLRLLVRDRLQSGDSDQQVFDYVVARYGEFVLLKPRFNAHTMLLWLFPLLILLIGLATMLISIRRRRVASAEQPLSAGEQAELARVLAEKEQ